MFFVSALINNKIEKPILNLSKQDTALNVDTTIYQLFSAGQKRLITDLLWISTLLESDLDHYSKPDLNSWMYHRFKSITTLDPKFEDAYQFGGRYLYIVKDDILGGKDILENGVKNYPNNYFINFDLGFLNTFELQDYQSGFLYFDKIKDHPFAPTNIKSILVKIKFSLDQNLEDTFQLVLDIYNKESNESIKYKLFRELYAIKAMIDLNCLNTSNNPNKNCSMSDYEGAPYLYNGKNYQAAKNYKEFKLHLNKKSKSTK